MAVAPLAIQTTITNDVCCLDFHLPDGRVLRLGAERFSVPELLIDPSPLEKLVITVLRIDAVDDDWGSDLCAV